MVSDSELIDRLRDFLRNADLDNTSNSSVRRQLETDFGIDLSDRKSFIREQITLFIQTEYQQPENDEGSQPEQEEEEGSDSKKNTEEEEEDDDDGNEEEEEEKPKRAKSGKKKGGLVSFCLLIILHSIFKFVSIEKIRTNKYYIFVSLKLIDSACEGGYPNFWLTVIGFSF